jgi:hypothetical protein
MMMLFAFMFWAASPDATTASAFSEYRPQKLAAYRAHTILPESLRALVKQHGKQLFSGLEKGLSQPKSKVTDLLILSETDKITQMVNHQRPFTEVVTQMGYVSGLISVFTNPSIHSNRSVRNGFPYYMNRKLPKFLFVFDGYDEGGATQAWLIRELEAASKQTESYRQVLEKKYGEVGGDHTYTFSERSAVFGVCSIYFSNQARLSAHLWYYAWARANGDLTNTPMLRQNIARR